MSTRQSSAQRPRARKKFQLLAGFVIVVISSHPTAMTNGGSTAEFDWGFCQGIGNRCVALMEQRKHIRYVLPAPVSFSWKDSRDSRRRSNGVLLNISGGGFFVLSHDLPPERALIELCVTFQNVFAGSSLVIRTIARVVRVKQSKIQEAGFAAVIRSFTLHSDEKSLVDNGAIDRGSKKQLM
jgi:PilZ domain